MEKSKLRVGIIGVGNIGSAHAACLGHGEIDGMTLSALCDTDPHKRARLAEIYPIVPIFDSHESLIASGLVDTVIVATPHKYHPPIAKAALEAGLHTLSEKPAGVDCQSVRELYEVAARSNGMFGIMFNQRTDPLFQKARELVQSGRLGEMKRMVWIITNWYRPQSYYDSGAWRGSWNGEGGGVLLNQAPHNLDIWQWICGMPTRLRAFCYRGKYHDISVEDDATIYTEYANGATGIFITSTGEYPGTNRLEITGDRGKLVIEHGRLTLTELEFSEREFRVSEPGTKPPAVSTWIFEEKTTRSGHALILQNFANSILMGESLIAPGTDGILELSLSNAAYLSADREDWIDLPPDGDAFLDLLHRMQDEEGGRVAGNCAATNVLDTTYRERWQVRW